MLNALKKIGIAESREVKDHFLNNGTAYAIRCNCTGQTAARSAAAAHAPQEVSRQHNRGVPLPNRLNGARQKLTTLTNAEWELVKPHAGRADTCGSNPQATWKALLIRIYLRTRAKIADPDAAYKAVRHFCRVSDQQSHASRIGKAAQVLIPVAWLRRSISNLTSDRPGQLADVFKPADLHARFKPDVELRVRRSKRTNDCGGEKSLGS